MADSTIATRAELELQQLASLRTLIEQLSNRNAFYRPRLARAGLDQGIESLDQFRQQLGFTLKEELLRDQAANPPYGTNLTEPLDRYSYFWQTSGTTGEPLRWLDTPESCNSMIACWKRVFEAAAVTDQDRVFFAFSFGPFLGFWVSYQAAREMGMMVLPGGGMSTKARLMAILENDVSVVCCTPTYAIRMGQVAAEEGIDLSQSKVKRIIVAGEPGGSVPSVRDQIQRQWVGARVFDHHGMTEVGPVSYENPDLPGLLHIIEEAFLAEVIDPETGHPVADGEIGELVLTTLKRTACPLLRYRTGDLVQVSKRSIEELGQVDVALEGGILGRSDDMVVVRGVNIYPSAVDEVIRRFDQVVEYRVEVSTQQHMSEIQISIEPCSECNDVVGLCSDIADILREIFQLRIPVSAAPQGQLPQFEMKAKRWNYR